MAMVHHHHHLLHDCDTMNKGIIALIVIIAIIVIAAVAYVLMTQLPIQKTANSTTAVSVPTSNTSANATQKVKANSSTGGTTPPPPPQLPPQ